MLRVLLSLPEPGRAPRSEPGFVVPVPPTGLKSWKRLGLPGSWMNLKVKTPCSQTPAGLQAPGHSQRWSMAAAHRNVGGSHKTDLSRLNHTAPSLAVYASQWSLPDPPRKTRYRLLAKLYRTGLVTR